MPSLEDAASKITRRRGVAFVVDHLLHAVPLAGLPVTRNAPLFDIQLLAFGNDFRRRLAKRRDFRQLTGTTPLLNKLANLGLEIWVLQLFGQLFVSQSLLGLVVADVRFAQTFSEKPHHFVNQGTALLVAEEMPGRHRRPRHASLEHVVEILPCGNASSRTDQAETSRAKIARFGKEKRGGDSTTVAAVSVAGGTVPEIKLSPGRLDCCRLLRLGRRLRRPRRRGRPLSVCQGTANQQNGKHPPRHPAPFTTTRSPSQPSSRLPPIGAHRSRPSHPPVTSIDVGWKSLNSRCPVRACPFKQSPYRTVHDRRRTVMQQGPEGENATRKLCWASLVLSAERRHAAAKQRNDAWRSNDRLRRARRAEVVPFRADGASLTRQ